MSDGQKKPNLKLRMERRQRGWSQSRLAEHIGADSYMISRWETGDRTPEPFYQEKLCILFNKTASELGFLEERQYPEHELPRSFQEISRNPLWQELSRTLEVNLNIGSATLEGLQQINTSYWSLRTSVGYRNILHALLVHLEMLNRLLKSSQSTLVYQQLCAIASEASQFIGAIYFDIRDISNATSYYKTSIIAAKEAKRYILLSTGLGRMSSLPIYNDNPAEALPFLKEAQRYAQKDCSSSLLAWLYALHAEALAKMQEKQACLKALGDAECALEKCSNEESKIMNFDYGRLMGYKGTCQLYLHQSKEALLTLKAVSDINSLFSPRQQAIIMTDTADAYVQQNEIEAACMYVVQALHITKQTRSRLVLERLLAVYTKLNLWQSTGVVKDVEEQLSLAKYIID